MRDRILGHGLDDSCRLVHSRGIRRQGTRAPVRIDGSNDRGRVLLAVPVGVLILVQQHIQPKGKVLCAVVGSNRDDDGAPAALSPFVGNPHLCLDGRAVDRSLGKHHNEDIRRVQCRCYPVLPILARFNLAVIENVVGVFQSFAQSPHDPLVGPVRVTDEDLGSAWSTSNRRHGRWITWSL